MDDLRRLAPPPPDPAPGVDWDAARASLHLRLPSDYQTLAEEWGAGSFDDFLWLLVPGHPNENLDLLRQAPRRLGALEQLAQGGEELPYPPRAEPGGLLPWGFTDNGDTCYWQLRNDGAGWRVVVNEARGPDWHRYDGGVADFLAAVLEGRERVAIFPADFPSDAPAFARY